MSYSTELKDILIDQEEEELEALISGFLRTSYSEEGFGSEQASLIRYVYFKLRQMGKRVSLANRKGSSSRFNRYYLMVEDSELLEELQVTEGGQPVARIPQYYFSRMKLKRAYLKGVFLACGSLSNPARSYHLEFKLDRESLAESLRGLCEDFDLKVSLGFRDRWLVYIKSSESIVDFLILMGASSLAFELENIKLIRSIKGDIHRRNNFDDANITRTINASARHVEAIERIQNTIGIAALPPSLQEIALLRWEEQELSLKELGESLDPPLSKSGVNNRLARLVKIAEKLEE